MRTEGTWRTGRTGNVIDTGTRVHGEQENWDDNGTERRGERGAQGDGDKGVWMTREWGMTVIRGGQGTVKFYGVYKITIIFIS